MQVLVGGLTVAVIYSLVFAYIRQEGFAYSFTHGMIVALGAMGIAFVLWGGMGIGFETTWPFWLYYAALLVIMSVFKWRSLSKIKKRSDLTFESAELKFQELCLLIKDVAHFAQKYYRSLHICCDGRQIFAALYITEGDEFMRQCRRLNGAQNIGTVFFEGYTPEYEGFFNDLLYSGTIEDWGMLGYSSTFELADIEEFRMITKLMKSHYSNLHEISQNEFSIGFDCKQ